MKTIDVDDELYRYIASHTQHIGESASDILRRMLNFNNQTAKITANRRTVTTDQLESPSLQQLLQDPEFTQEKKAINRFMRVLSALYHIDNARFAEATAQSKGRTRLYFANDEHTLLASGTQTKPKIIPGSPYWVITNTNSARKRVMIAQIMSIMQLPQELSDKICDYV